MIQKIISGGQTGADRAALDWAIANDIGHGGWCPAGWRAEDGLVPDLYCLRETQQRNYRQRTQWNVRDSDATLIITPAAELTGGSLLTQEWAQKINRPCLHVYRCNEWREWIRIFFGTNSTSILNVAGPRSSGAAGIQPR
ncbi:putative molybdenum carrier protein [Nitrosospira sp. Nsp1]|uniref:putative molybdenum carrier protein n=1 Tax=Nitrosospira sp. Nsp1 TaxID=136547 RepID=UPI000AFB71CF|nr:putative molybdenum carrier protein [Nitrosospira sp. Nsp1]